MAANTITRARLRRLADVSPDRGRVLSVFLNLDPSELPTPAARASAITSIMTEAAHRIEAEGELGHDEQEALKADVERVREVLDAATSPPTATAPWPSSPASPRTCSRSSPLRHPLASARGARPQAPRRAARLRGRRRALVRAARQPPRRPPVRRRRRRAGGDRPHRGRRPPPARPGRLVAGQLPAQRRQGEGRSPRSARPTPRSRSTSAAGSTGCWSARPRSSSASSRSSCTPTCASAWSAACSCDVEHSTLDEVPLERRREDRRARAQDASARRSTAWPRASAAASAGPAACPACSTRSTRRGWRRC